MSRVSEAKRILDIAEKEFLKGKSLKDLRLKYDLSSSAIGNFIQSSPKTAALFVVNGIVKAVIDTKNKEDFKKQLLGLIGDGSLAALTFLITKANPYAMLVSPALSIIGIDPSTGYKKLYDWITGNNDALLLDQMKISEYNGILTVKMRDGREFRRPLNPHSSYSREIIGSNNNDVLFGGTGNDTLSGLGGSDVLVGGIGADHYVAHNGDVIIDEDGMGYVELDWNRLTGGKYDKSKKLM